MLRSTIEAAALRSTIEASQSKVMSTKTLSGPKDLMTLMKNIALKLKIEEFDVIVEFSSNKFKPDSSDFSIKGVYNTEDHSKYDYPEDLAKRVFSVTKDPIIDDFKVYKYKAHNYFKPNAEVTELVKVTEIDGKYGKFKNYTIEPDYKLEDLGDIEF